MSDYNSLLYYSDKRFRSILIQYYKTKQRAHVKSSFNTQKPGSRFPPKEA